MSATWLVLIISAIFPLSGESIQCFMQALKCGCDGSDPVGTVEICGAGLLRMVEECSRWGEEWGKQHRLCSSMVELPPGIRHQHSRQCLSAAHLACAQALRERRCQEGMEKAKVSGVCPMPAIPTHLSDCCGSCLLGLEVGKAGEGCGETHFGKLRGDAYKACCRQYSPEDSQTAPAPGVNGGRNVCEELAGELCAHICIPTPESYRCSCRPGFWLMSDGKSCTPAESCDDCSHGCEVKASGEKICTCPPGLILGPDRSTCGCPTGFRLLPNQTCEEIDECLDDEDEPACDSSQICENTVGSFRCICKPGFKQDPITLACIDVNECQLRLHNCGSFQRCDNTIGSFVCVRDINCGTGYTLRHETGLCEDDNECELGTPCAALGPDYECRNTQGSFRCYRKNNRNSGGGSAGNAGGGAGGNLVVGSSCSHGKLCTHQLQCPAGFSIYNNMCRDVNECEEGLAKCGPNQRCINIQGSYLCSDILSCKPGFRLNPSKTQCIDINECEEQERLCGHICENRWGSYRCRCRPGYKLHTDNRTCVDVDECEDGFRCQGICRNQPGSYVCSCPAGYKISQNRHSCLDINECDETVGNVCQDETEVCVNLAGSYRCASVACPSGYHRDASRRTRCQRVNMTCLVDDEECRRQPATYTYNFITMVSNYTIPRSGSVKLFTVESMWGSTSPDFKLELLEARVPPGRQAATRDDFNLVKEYGRATLELVHTLIGPQEIQMELRTEFYNSNNIFLGVSVFHIEIYVSQYHF